MRYPAATPTEWALVCPRPGVVVIEFRGDHDLITADAVEGLLAVLISGNDLIVVDLSEADFIDSSFLHHLVRRSGCARRREDDEGAHGQASVVVRALMSSGGHGDPRGGDHTRGGSGPII